MYSPNEKYIFMQLIQRDKRENLLIPIKHSIFDSKLYNRLLFTTYWGKCHILEESSRDG